MLNYRKSYYITHPWKLFEEIFYEIKWAWQRIFRGWDDRVIWSIDLYLSEMMPIWLNALMDAKHGVPLDIFDDVECSCDEHGGYDNETFERAQKYYNQQIKEIILAFECSEVVILGSFSTYKEFDQWQLLEYGNIAELSFEDDSEYDKRSEKFKLFEKIREESKELDETRKKGFVLLDKWWYSLWD